jgi:uncharacterized protein (TIGR03086 family)
VDTPLGSLNHAERHRRICAGFTEHVASVSNWDAPTPVADWTNRDVVDHLVDWSRDFLQSGGIQLASPPAGAPAQRWSAHSAEIQALLEGADADAAFTHPYAGTHALTDAIDRFYTTDLFMHTWDLATACGRDSGLDPTFAAEVLEGMAGMEEVLRSSGQFGPAVDVPADADPVRRLMGFIGRDPGWH